ncbi:tether containing UBX domain for GLUT4 isoform X2 [Parasteatoda tepidariorum]
MGDFKPASTLFDILKQFLGPDAVTLKEKSEPVCVYMRQQISGEAIKSTTLRSLGLTKGTAIIRLMFRELEQLDSQAHVSSPLTPRPVPELLPTSITNKSCYSEKLVESSENKINTEMPAQNEFKAGMLPKETPKQPCESTSNNKRAIGEMSPPLLESKDISDIKKSNRDVEHNNVPSCNIPDQNENKILHDLNANGKSACAIFKAETKTEEMEYDLSIEDVDVGDINYIGDRHAVLYSLDDITDVKKADLPDEFFELTVKDVRYLMEEYKRDRNLMESQPLLTKEQRDRQLCQKFSTYSQTVIRIYFPEKLVLQAVFMITETVETVCEFVRNYLEKKDICFYLYTTPPKEKLIYSKTLLECLLVPAAVVHFGSDVQLPHYLNTSLRQKKSDPRAAALAAAQSRMESVATMDIDKSFPCTSTSIPLENSSATTSTLNESSNLNSVPPKPGAVPKWLRLSKK